MLLVNLLAALNFANVFFKFKKTFGKLKKTFKKRKKRDQNKKNVKKVFYMYDAGSAAMASGLASFHPGPGVGTANVVAASAGCLVCEISDHTRRRCSIDRPTGTCRWRNEELGGPSTDIHVEPSLHSHHRLPFRSLPSSYPCLLYTSPSPRD